MRTAFLWSLTAVAAVTAQSISKTGRCGLNQGGLTCKGSTSGNCCSQYGWCGDTLGHCDAKSGCQAGYGMCSGSASTPVSLVSTDGKCGSNGKTCLGSRFGGCCSEKNWCGTSSDHCSADKCQSRFGSCSRAASTLRTSTRASTPASVPTPPSSFKPSTDARCGYGNDIKSNQLGQSCIGSRWGDCCSQYGYCGSTSGYCAAGCQTTWGKCSPIKSSSKSTSFSSSRSLPASSSTKVSTTLSLTSTKPLSSSSPATSSSLSSAKTLATSSPSVSSSSIVSSATTSSTVASSVRSSESSSASGSSSAQSLSTSLSTSIVLSAASTSTSSPESVPFTTTESSSASSSPGFSSSTSHSVSTSLTLSAPIVSPSGRPECSPNYVVNGGFESGVLSPFTPIYHNGLDVNVLTAFSAHTGSYLLRATGNTEGLASPPFILETEVEIPAGKKVTVNMWARSMRTTDNACSFMIGFGNNVLAQVNPSGATRNAWVRVGTGDGVYTAPSSPGNRQTLAIFVVCSSAAVPQFELDDISIVDVDACPSTPSTSSVSSTISLTSDIVSSSTPALSSSSQSLSTSDALFSSSSISSASSSSIPTASETVISSVSSTVSEIMSSSSSLSFSSSDLSLSTSTSTSASMGSSSEIPLNPTTTRTPTSACVTNYFENPGFESGFGPWTSGIFASPTATVAVIGSNNAHTGDNSLFVSIPSYNPNMVSVSQFINFVGTTTVKFGVWYKTILPPAGRLTISLTVNGRTVAESSSIVRGVWAYLSTENVWISGGGRSEFEILISASNADTEIDQIVYIDDVVLSQVAMQGPSDFITYCTDAPQMVSASSTAAPSSTSLIDNISTSLSSSSSMYSFSSSAAWSIFSSDPTPTPSMSIFSSSSNEAASSTVLSVSNSQLSSSFSSASEIPSPSSLILSSSTISVSSEGVLSSFAPSSFSISSDVPAPTPTMSSSDIVFSSLSLVSTSISSDILTDSSSIAFSSTTTLSSSDVVVSSTALSSSSDNAVSSTAVQSPSSTVELVTSTLSLTSVETASISSYSSVVEPSPSSSSILEPTPTTSNIPFTSSSSVVDTVALSSSSSIVVVNPEPTSTSSPSPTPKPQEDCFAWPQNYVTNYGFEFSPARSFWDIFQTPSNGPFDMSSSGVWGNSGYNGDNGFSVKTKANDPGKVDGTFIIQQGNIMIPDGTQVDVWNYVRPTRGPKDSTDKPFEFTIKFDGIAVGSHIPNYESNTKTAWKSTWGKKTITVRGDGPHTISLESRTMGVANTWVFDIDNFWIQAQKGPNGQKLCKNYTPA